MRQLQTSNYRPQIGARAGTAAYVVGDPLVSPPFRQLPGAAAEADAVYEQLRRRFDVDSPVKKPSALDVLAGLYEKALSHSAPGRTRPLRTADDCGR